MNEEQAIPPLEPKTKQVNSNEVIILKIIEDKVLEIDRTLDLLKKIAEKTERHTKETKKNVQETRVGVIVAIAVTIVFGLVSLTGVNIAVSAIILIILVAILILRRLNEGQHDF